ncbi:filamentous hemagglutinin transporter [Parasponia andersonii]|uniref:Filamentous hemagglutinin transporter n=1 Tax=Parasponia andersonii TaxID=3476 RepID=A0A2P5APS5_PARAD|nr:filamentous hemagglutinin transporter [Parasponia andersonii]
MAADVSSLVRVMSGYKDDQRGSMGTDSSSEKSTALITRDLLGGSSYSSSSKMVNDTQELDLDLQVPNGWEKRLDLKSGKVYLQRCGTPNPNSYSGSDHNKHQSNTTVPKLQDLNFPASPSSKTPLNLFDDTSLDLKLVSSSSPSTSPNYQSVCTLDKVKSALERAEKEPVKRRSSSSSMWKSSSPSYSSSSSSIKESQEDENEEKLLSPSFAAGCPGCLTYVLIMKNNPKCPRCNSVIPLPLMKKPRIDLNMAI